jgi:hypothetical protein
MALVVGVCGLGCATAAAAPSPDASPAPVSVVVETEAPVAWWRATGRPPSRDSVQASNVEIIPHLARDEIAD